MPADTAAPSPSVFDLQRQIDELNAELRARIAERDEAQRREAAVAEIIQVTNASAGDLAQVFGAMIEKAVRLCSAAYGYFWLYNGQQAVPVASYAQQQFGEWLLHQRGPSVPTRESPLGRVLLDHRLVHVVDAHKDPAYRGMARFRELVDRGGVRTLLHVPLNKGKDLLGVITVYRQERQPFSDAEIRLLEAFAEQAVIAIENARLITEQREALEQQTATAEVLQVINASPGNLAPVFDAILEKAMTLCGVAFGFLTIYDGKRFTPAAMRGVPPALAEYFAAGMDQPQPGDAHHRVLEGEDVIHHLDQKDEETYRLGSPLRHAVVDLGGARSALVVALRKEGVVLGALTVYRKEVRPFSDKEIALMQGFAAQAVIAMENARLLTEQREALEQQTATAEVLQAINASPGNLAPVFDVMLEKAMTLCGAAFGMFNTFDGRRFHSVAMRGVPEAYARYRMAHPPDYGSATGPGRLLAGEDCIHIVDLTEGDLQQSDPNRRAIVELGGARTILGVALRKEGALLGMIAIYRQEVRPFTDKQIALLQNFAAQAVIAMENARLLTEQREALEQQTATAEVLQTINASPGNLAPVFDAMLERAVRLSDSAFGMMNLYDDGSFRRVALHSVPERLIEQPPPGPHNALQRVADGEDVVHIEDLAASRSYLEGDARTRGLVDVGGARSLLAVALRKDGKLVGTLTAYRQEVRPFTDKHIALLQGFAAQAVIAIENARLLDELRTTLERQTATAEVLRIISESPGRLEPVFEAVLTNAARISGGAFGMLALIDRGGFQGVATYAVGAEYSNTLSRIHDPPPGTGLDQLRRTLRTVEVSDCAIESAYDSVRSLNPAFAAVRTALHIPMLRDTELIGAILIYRDKVEPFQPDEIELVENFARQAVIAIENARLLDELRQRQAELARSVDELTATGDVLKIISRSSVDLKTVLETLVERVARLCGADQGYMFRRQDELHHLVAAYGVSPEGEEFVRNHPFVPERGTVAGRVTLERRPIHIVDVLEDPDYTYREGQAVTGFRTMLGIPLLREETLVGVFVLGRMRVEPFTNKEIDLATTFADQAVIAIENARLFEEIRKRQAELRVTFDNMGDGVVMFDADLRLAAWNRNFQGLLDIPDSFLTDRPGFDDYVRLLVERGELGKGDESGEIERYRSRASELWSAERVRPDGRVVEVRNNPVPGGGVVLIYSDITERKRSEEQIRAARDAAETALRDLQTAQASLLHAQKMAALGQLTAGIAHEIKNPLNFVNNFAGLSVELLDELKETMTPLRETLDAERRTGIDEAIELLNTNLDKIASHGRRADGIVRSMLLHSRGGSGERQSVDINAILEEALNLAYHGARAQDQSFNVTLERDLQPDMPPIEIVPQDMTRVFLNLIGNGFYAVARQARPGSDASFRPTLEVRTRDLGEAVEIAIRDNGIGISAEHRARLFQPFFTTKPTGEGTGLGLSISYDIVTQQHGGTVEVESEPGQFTQFTVRLPRRGSAATGRKPA
ncbi:MAG TPA: GAF domain-containing protein [Reyranella sp.]|nr:GAF domain-containing protein [Reyranella sp.]